MISTSIREQEIVHDSEAKYRATYAGIANLVEYIVEHAKPLKVIAFGSRARGNHHSESDLDLAVLVNDPAQDQKIVREARSLSRTFFAVDLLVFSPDRYDRMKASPVSVEHQIDCDGVVLYDSISGTIHHELIGRLAG